MSMEGEVGLDYLRYQIESSLAHRGQERARYATDAISQRLFRVPAQNTHATGLSINTPTYTNRSAAVPRSAAAFYVREPSAMLANVVFRPAAAVSIQVAYSPSYPLSYSLQVNSTEGASVSPELRDVAKRLPRQPCSDVYIYINSKTGVVRVRDYFGRINGAMIHLLKRWSELFKRNGRVE